MPRLKDNRSDFSRRWNRARGGNWRPKSCSTARSTSRWSSLRTRVPIGRGWARRRRRKKKGEEKKKKGKKEGKGKGRKEEESDASEERGEDRGRIHDKLLASEWPLVKQPSGALLPSADSIPWDPACPFSEILSEGDPRPWERHGIF